MTKHAGSQTDSYRCETYDEHTPPVERPTGVAGPSETVEHRSYDHDQLSGGKVLSTVRDRAETKVVTAGDDPVTAK